MVRFGLLIAILGGFIMEAHAQPPEGQKFWVFVGTYTGPNSQGIYRLEFDAASGKLGAAQLAAKSDNPSFLAIHPSGKYLYAVNEVGMVKGQKGGGVSAFALDAETGELTFLNQQSSGGGAPCHIVVDPAGKNVLVANYSGGSVCVLPIAADGKLKPASSFVQHEGKGVNKSRQEAPHAHSINVGPTGKFAYAADLGLDKVLIYRFDADKGTLEPADPASAAVKPGAGPRHFAFHPSGKYAYVINELDLTVTAFDHDAQSGALKPRQTVATLPNPPAGSSTAEIVVHPSGKFLYGSNRGHNSIAIFAIDAATGALEPRGHQAAGIKTPRNFAIDPTGRYLLVGNQSGDNISVFAIDAESGQLKAHGESVAVPAPVCLRFRAR